MTDRCTPSSPVRTSLGISIRACPMAIAVAMFASALLSSGLLANGPTTVLAEQRSAQRRLPDVVVDFLFEQANATTDEITILFTNAPAGPTLQSRQPTEDRAEQQFSFSGRDYPKGLVTFSRRVPDSMFLNSRFIRIVNRGTNRWFPSTITMTVDGRRVLDKLSMYPRKGQDPKGGIERWGQPNASFWETDLQRFRSKAD